MIRAMWSAASGMEAQQLRIDTVANNLANVNTTGFKRSLVNFQDLLYESLRAPGADGSAAEQIPAGIQIGHGTRPISIAKVFTQGDFASTGRQLDVAIEGQGFFEVTLPDGTEAYTRDGSLNVTSDGKIVTNDGYEVAGWDNLDEGWTEVIIGSDGAFTVLVNGKAQTKTPITLKRFINPSGLKSIGRNLYVETEASGTPEEGTPGENGFGTIAQKMLEMSNVQIVEEMVNMIMAQRAYEINSKAIQTGDEMLQMANNMRR